MDEIKKILNEVEKAKMLSDLILIYKNKLNGKISTSQYIYYENIIKHTQSLYDKLDKHSILIYENKINIDEIINMAEELKNTNIIERQSKINELKNNDDDIINLLILFFFFKIFKGKSYVSKHRHK